MFWLTESWWWLALGAPALLALGVVVARWVRERFLLAASRRLLEARGVRCLVIYSESPNWEEHIRSTWLPRLGTRAVLLNWSQRSTWTRSLEVLLFKHFVRPTSHSRNFNPAVLVLRGGQQPLVFRFYEAFEQARHGRRQYLETLEEDLFKELNV